MPENWHGPIIPPDLSGTCYDYYHQAWVQGGVYVACGHPWCADIMIYRNSVKKPPSKLWNESLEQKAKEAVCYGSFHEGEPVDPESLKQEQVH